MLANKLNEILLRQGTGEKVALEVIAAFFHQQLFHFLGFHAFHKRFLSNSQDSTQ